MAIVVCIAALAGCGGSGSHENVPGGANSGDVQVIKRWADELRAGDVQAATDRFTLPTVVANGTAPLQLTARREILAFNESLPCGARLVRAQPSGRFTVATFVLTERPGPGQCGAGVGQTAQTAFEIKDGKIAEWRRVAEQPPATAPESTAPII